MRNQFALSGWRPIALAGAVALFGLVSAGRAAAPAAPADPKLVRLYRVLRFDRAHPAEAADLIRARLQAEPDALPGLVELTTNTQATVRTLVAMLLGDYGDARGADTLWRMTRDDQEVVRITAAGAVVRLSRIVPIPARPDGLKDQRAEVRRLTAATLAGIGDKAAEAALLDALRDPDELVRCDVVKALARDSCGTETAVPSLIEMLTDKSALVRDRTATTLGQFEDPIVVPHLVRALQDQDWHVRAGAALSLGGWVTRQANVTGPLIERLEQDDFALVRDRAADALAAAPADERAVDSLVKAILTGKRDARFHARDAIVRGRAVLALPKLMEHRHDEDPLVRAAVIRTFGDIGGEEQVAAVVEALADADPEVRRTATVALARLHPSAENLARLDADTADPDPHVRAAAATALGDLGRKEAVPKLIALLRDDHGYVRGAAASALGKLGDRSAIAPLISVLNADQLTGSSLPGQELIIGAGPNDLPEVARMKLIEEKIRVVIAMGELYSPEMLDPLVAKGLKSEDAGLRATTAYVLGKGGDPRAIGPLQEVVKPYYEAAASRTEAEGNIIATETMPETVRTIKEKEARVRASVAWALGQIGDPAAVEVLTKAREDVNSMVRDAAVEALSKIHEREEYRAAQEADKAAAAVVPSPPAPATP